MNLDDLEFELRKLPGVRAVGFEDRPDVLLVQLHLAPDQALNLLEVPLPVSAARIAARLSDHLVAVEVVRWRNTPSMIGDDEISIIYDGPGADVLGDPTITPDLASGVTPIAHAPSAVSAPVPSDATGPLIEERRPRLLAVLAFPETDEVEVHLVFKGKRAIGRAPGSDGPVAAVHATLDALTGLDINLDPEVHWLYELEPNLSAGALIAVAITVHEGGSIECYGLAPGATTNDAAARATLDALNRRISRPFVS